MSVLPSQTLAEITFGEAHHPVWSANFASIGMASAQAAAVKAAVLDARAKFDAAQAARQASKAATNALNVSATSMHTLLSDAIQTIRLYAETTHNNSVYTLAQIPAPANPQPAPPPDQPTNLGVELLAGGTLRLIFKAVSTAAGPVAYLIKRKLAGESGFTVVGSAGSSRATGGAALPRGFKFFDDATLPTGANNVQYMVQGQRGDVFGLDSEIFTVTIGHGLTLGADQIKMAA